MKLLAKPEDYYGVDIDIYGGGTNDPTYTISIQDESDDGIPPLCDVVNKLVEKGLRFTKFELSGDDIGWKVFKMEMRLRKDLIGPDHYTRHYNWDMEGKPHDRCNCHFTAESPDICVKCGKKWKN